MGAIVAKRTSGASQKEARETPGPAARPESRPRSVASTVSVSSVGIPLPPRPPPRQEDTTEPPIPPPSSLSRTPRSPQQTADTETLSDSGTATTDDAERSVSVDSGREMVERCLRALEAAFGISFEREQLLDSVQEAQRGPGETLMAAKQAAVGVYIVKEGGLEVVSPDQEVPLCSLAAGEFCGELSSFFRIPCSATVRTRPGVSIEFIFVAENSGPFSVFVKLKCRDLVFYRLLCPETMSTAVLLLPLLALSQSSHVEQVPMHRMLTWCTKRSYISTGVMFDKSKSNLLVTAQIANCLKSPKSLFSTWSTEAINHIATNSKPLLFSSGDVLYEAGEEPSCYFLILRGSVEMCSGKGSTARSSCLTVRSSSEGACIGREVFAGSRMAHTATALSPLLTVPITLDLLRDTVNEFPSDAPKLRSLQDGNLM